MRDLVLLQDRHGLVVRRREEVARVREEAFGRLEVLDGQGELAWRPGPLEALAGPPLVSGEGCLLNPAHVGPGGVLPGGWRVKGDLAVPARLEAVRPKPDGVLYLEGRGGKAWWVTDRGTVPAGDSADKAARGHPELVKAGRGTWVNVRRLRAIRCERKRFRLILEGGVERTVSWGARHHLEEALGVSNLDALEPAPEEHRALYREGLQDWPHFLKTAPEAWLRAEFAGDARRLIANVLWQIVRGRTEHGYRQLRDVWYEFVHPPLVRVGFMDPPGQEPRLAPRLALRALEAGSLAALEGWRRPEGRLYDLFELVSTALVGDYRLFTYRELGMVPSREDLRVVGQRRPGLVVVAEKSAVERAARALVGEFGCSAIVLGGLPTLIGTEFFAEDLRAAGVGEVRLVDFDPGGWVAASAFADQLLRYGVRTSGVHHLVLPSRFTAEEIGLYAFPLHAPTPQAQGRVKAWLKRSGGVRGRALGIHANHLWPVERVIRAFLEEVGGLP